MKVLFINYVITIGGATLALKELLLELKNNGIEPIVCTSKRDDFNTFLDDNGIKNIVDGHREVMETIPKSKIKRIIKYLVHKPLYYVAQYRALRIIEKSVDLNEIDIIHSNSVRSDLGCLIHKKYAIPHVMHIREFAVEHFGCRIYRKGYYDYLNNNCTTILAVSDTVRTTWISHGIEAGKIQTLYNGVDFRRFSIKKLSSKYTNDLKMVLVGAVYDGKGQHIAIEAMNKLPETIKEHVWLDFIGWHDPTKYFKYLKNLISNYDLDERVRFLGDKDDVANQLLAYDIGLMCSKAEGFGRVTVEYMYAGLGVIVANTGASPELVENNVNGLLYERDNPEDLAEKILRFYNQRDLLGIYGRKAHDDVKEKFTSQRNAIDILRVYESIC